MAGSRITAVDRKIGERVKVARMAAGISQEKLADVLGVTFQQVQKYEKGTNRVAPGRLDAIARKLGVPITYFFADDFADKVNPTIATAHAFMASKDGMRLIQAAAKLKSVDSLRAVAALVEEMA